MADTWVDVYRDFLSHNGLESDEIEELIGQTLEVYNKLPRDIQQKLDEFLGSLERDEFLCVWVLIDFLDEIY